MVDITVGDRGDPTVTGAAARTPANPTRPMIFVTRYCTLEASSLAAAVRESLDILGHFASHHPEIKPKPPIVIYRNQRNSTVTLDTGLPIDREPDATITGELGVGRVPSGRRVRSAAGGSLGQMLSGAALMNRRGNDDHPQGGRIAVLELESLPRESISGGARVSHGCIDQHQAPPSFKEKQCKR